MTYYLGRHAELYDLFYQDKPYQEETEFVNSCLQSMQTGTTKRILELACGTGNYSFLLEKFGYEMAAIDISEDMLDRAMGKADQFSSRIRFMRQDMRELNFEEGFFDAAVCLFDSLGYVATNEALHQVFQGVHRALRTGGLFIFEFWHSAAVVKHYDPVRVRRWSVPETEILRISETTLNTLKQQAVVRYNIYELRSDGSYTHFEESQTNRYFSVPEMEQWLVSHGFVPVRWFSGFQSGESITDQTWHIVAVARRS